MLRNISVIGVSLSCSDLELQSGTENVAESGARRKDVMWRASLPLQNAGQGFLLCTGVRF